MFTEQEKREFRVARVWFKSQMRTLASSQRAAKRLRKTKVSKSEQEDILKRLPDPVSGLTYMTIHQAAVWDVKRRAVRVTALLNWWHEVRGSTHRHNVPDDLKYMYQSNVDWVVGEVKKLAAA